MRLEGWIFGAIAIFLAPIVPVYWYLAEEPVGTTALILTFGLCFLIGYYFLFTSRRIDPRPEDDNQAEISDGAGELGFFSPHSWWPLFLGGSLALLVLGGIFGWWLMAVALPFVAVSVFGIMFEYYRGDHAH